MVFEAYNKLKRAAGDMLAGETLKAKTLRGGVWLGAGSAADQLFRFGRSMVLTRILAPEAFGTMAIVNSATIVLASFLDVGAREALVQNPKGHEDEYVGATWWMTFGRSVSLYLCLFVLAPLAAHIYGNVELTPLMRVAGIGVIFEGLMSARAYVAMKQMKLNTWAIINHGGGIAGTIITVILSFVIRDVWALVLGFVAENVARCILSFAFCPFLPPRRWDRAAMRDLLKFSKGLFGLSILNLLFLRADIFVLAKLFAPAALGLYVMAVYLVQTPSWFIINVINQTMMPTLSHVQDDNPRINRILLQATAAIFLIGTPAIVFLFFCGHSLLTVLFGQQYGAGSAALSFASCAALLNVANIPITNALYAKGLPQLHRRCVATMAILMILLIYPLAKWFGLVGGQIACLISMAAGYLFQVERIGKLTNLSLPQYWKNFLAGALASLGVVAICVAARVLPAQARPLPNILIGIVGCLVAYSLAGVLVIRKPRFAQE
jgi:lipopolysaccharide exporter